MISCIKSPMTNEYRLSTIIASVTRRLSATLTPTTPGAGGRVRGLSAFIEGSNGGDDLHMTFAHQGPVARGTHIA